MKRKKQELPSGRELPLLETVKREKIEFLFKKRRKWKRWYPIYMATVATAAVLALAVLAAGVWKNGWPWKSAAAGDGTPTALAELIEGLLLPDREDLNGGLPVGGTPSDPSSPSLDLESLYEFDYGLVPEGALPILPMDLSLTEYGDAYIQNLTGLQPDTEALLSRDLTGVNSPELLSASDDQEPLVLIVHTHGTEAYSEDGAISYVDNGDELARSQNIKENVVAVGKTLADELNRLGISTLHCEIMHDAVQYKDSYARAEETIRRYLEEYPGIRLVIDLHRDSIIKSTGEMIRPVTVVNGEAAAQVMCVVGSTWGGEENPNWEGNLALALQLRKRLNDTYGNLCRPPYLKSSTYNQELSPYSLLLEIGACGNSPEEAKRSALAVAEALAELVGNL